MVFSVLFRIPLYLSTLFYLFWSVQIAGFLYYVDFFNFRTPRADLLKWALMQQKFFRIKYFRHKSKETLYQTGKCMYLCNHRSWADFFVDHYVTGGRSAALSRLMVWVALPVFMTYGIVSRSMFFFRRGTIQNKENFNKWLDKSWNASPLPGMIVYPEGHRNLTTKSLALKKGMLRYAFLRKVPCQIVLSQNKEGPFNEKTWSVQFGCTVKVAYSEVFYPQNFDEFEDFLKEVYAQWEEIWNLVYIKDEKKEDLVPFVWKDIESFDVPFGMRILCAIAMLGGMALFLLQFYAMLRLFLWSYTFW